MAGGRSASLLLHPPKQLSESFRGQIHTVSPKSLESGSCLADQPSALRTQNETCGAHDRDAENLCAAPGCQIIEKYDRLGERLCDCENRRFPRTEIPPTDFLRNLRRLHDFEPRIIPQRLDRDVLLTLLTNLVRDGSRHLNRRIEKVEEFQVAGTGEKNQGGSV